MSAATSGDGRGFEYVSLQDMQTIAGQGLPLPGNYTVSKGKILYKGGDPAEALLDFQRRKKAEDGAGITIITKQDLAELLRYINTLEDVARRHL